MFFSAEDDDQDFMSTGGSKLANLFGMDKASGQGGNESLTYTAPKQPKKKDAAPDGSTTPTVVVASVVHSYKYVDNKYTSQGKLGAALLSTPATREFRILLYVNRQQQVTNAKITPTFSFNVQQNNYASFYDDARQMWSVMFDTTEAAEKFAREIALAKANSGTVTDLIQQDLSVGDGGGLDIGDSAEVKYTGWLLTNGALGKVFDQSAEDNYFRFKVGKGKVIKGWDQGMLGMQKGGKRLLIIPPSLGYGSQGVSERIPPNSTLVFEVQVVRVKLQKGDSPSASPAPLPTLGSLPDQDDFDDPGVKGRTRSINEQMSQNADSGKAKLISRMARMGQPMLPFQGAIAAQPDDSDEEVHPHIQPGVLGSSKPPLPTKPRSSPGVNANSPGQVISQASPQLLTNQSFAMVNGQPMVISSDMLQQQQQQQQPAFLQNLPGAQQVTVYQNPNTFLQQQQAALLQQQQQQLLQQQQQQQQQQLLSQSLSAVAGGIPGNSTAFGATPAASQAVSSSSSADALAPVLLTETRQQNTEVRIGLSKMSDKVDKILDKVELLSTASLGAHSLGMMTPYGGNLPAPSMEANVLMQNVSRIVQENERLKKEVYEQSNKVQELNMKISDLLERNQKYVEQSQNLLEQRNEGYKSSATQSQAKVLSLEQEKVQLATDLSTASAHITTLQLELAEYRKREGELKQQLQMTSSVSINSREELERLRLQKEEDEQKINNLNASIRDEKLARKSVETKLASHQEEVSELKTLNETLEKSLSERKRKAAEERRKLEEELEDAKMNYERTIEDLREKLRRQKSSVDSDTQSKVSRLEEEISREWQAKSERMLSAAAEKHSRQLTELNDEKRDLLSKVEELERKLAAVRSTGSSTEQQVAQLQDDLAEMKLWKDKYDNLRSQATTMKERYEKRITELEQEKEDEEEGRNELVEREREQRQELQHKIQQLQQEVQHLQTQLSMAKTNVQQAAAASAPLPASPSADVATEVKKIMNSVFQTLRGEFDADESYVGSEVLTTILGVIKQTTLKLVSQPPAARQESDEDKEEDEVEEEEEDEEAEEEEEDEEGQDTVSPSRTEAQDDEDEEEEEEEEEAVSSEITGNTAEESTSVSTSVQSATTRSSLQTEYGSSSADEKETKSGETMQSSQLSTSLEKDSTGLEDVPSLETDVQEEVASDSPEEQSKIAETVADEDEDFLTDEADNKSESKLATEETSSTLNEIESEVIDEEVDRRSETSVDPPRRSHQEEKLPPPVSLNQPAVPTETVVNGGKDSAPEPDMPVEKQTKEQTQQDLLKASLNVTPKPATDLREPPPLFDDDDDDDDSSIFGTDSVVAETVKPAVKKLPVAKATPPAPPASKDKSMPGKKSEPSNDEDLKPQPPPPLFGDDSDDDDLDWLN